MGDSTKIRVNGSIINELSEKIPTNIVAINELIKNAFDANAEEILITFDSSKEILIISDNGNGMGKEEIDELFHLAQSSKKFGEMKNGRYVQGSKGLGFLSVFRFGSYVTWRTNVGDSGIEFSVDRDKLVSQHDISNYEIILKTNNDIPKGTRIEIQMTGVDIKSILSDFSNDKIVEKITNSFIYKNMDSKDINAKPFSISFSVDGKTVDSHAENDISKVFPTQQIFHITYKSSDNKILFSHNNCFAFSIPFEFTSTEYECNIDLMSFGLKPGQVKQFPPLYLNPQMVSAEITPLIYINENLFNNYSLFDPNITRKKQNTQTLPQLIGTIGIISNNPDLIFNSDRSQFVQNPLTEHIKNFLQKINMTIQIEGGKRKKYLPDHRFFLENPLDISAYDDEEKLMKALRANIAVGFAFRNKIDISIEDDSAYYLVFNKRYIVTLTRTGVEPTHNPKLRSPVLELTEHHKKFNIYNNPIFLVDFISVAQYSSGEPVSTSDIVIEIDGVENNRIDCIETECSMEAIFLFLDPQTGIAMKKRLQLSFSEPSSGVSGRAIESKLIIYPGPEDYEVNFLNSISPLVNQINEINAKGLDQYKEIIACSLRTLFELSIDAIKLSTSKNNGLPQLQTTLMSPSFKLSNKVKETILFVKNYNIPQTPKGNFLNIVDSRLPIGYLLLDSKLDPEDYFRAVNKANLATHKSADWISTDEIKDLGKKIGFFLVIVNELLK